MVAGAETSSELTLACGGAPGSLQLRLTAAVCGPFPPREDARRSPFKRGAAKRSEKTLGCPTFEAQLH